MCGIFFCIFNDGQCRKDKIEHLIRTVKPLITRRGPDDLNTKEKVLFDHGTNQTYKLILMGAVLHLRGSLTSQPLEDDAGNVLIWNGEVFDGVHIPEDSNDTVVLSHLLGNQSNSASHVLSILSNIQGPWSFVYYQPTEGKLWFGRDYFGRRSLVWHLPRDDNNAMAVSSVAQRCAEHSDTSWVWEEVPADGIYCLTTNPQNTTQNQLVETFNFNHFKLEKYPWMLTTNSLGFGHDICTIPAPIKPFNKNLPTQSDLECLVEELKNHDQANGLGEKSQWSSAHTDINEARILERGSTLVHSENESDINNVDKTLIDMTLTSKNVKLEEEEELVQKKRDYCSNLEANCPLFEQPSAATLNNIGTLEELCNKAVLSIGTSELNTTSVKHNNTSASFVNGRDSDTLKLRGSQCLPESLILVLGKAVRKRVFNLPRASFGCEKQQVGHEEKGLGSVPAKPLSGKKEELQGNDKNAGARVGILFSGGIDSIVLAALADRFVPKTEAIDLINVAFEQKVPKQNPTNKRKTKPNEQEEWRLQNFDVPDRLTGRLGVLELNNINPVRHWNFIEVNVTLKDLQKARSQHITHLVSPLNSVLDDSIGCALWFAARGSGVLRCPRCIMGAEGDSRECAHPYEYTSLAKVVLVGMGADEQLGGYARHRTKFSQHGWRGLIDEMEMEVNRISERNLGRDDRCISDHGREARFPFLDEQVVSFLSGLPVWLKADLRLPRGTGEKILLRQAAKLLGLTSSAVLPKRAIQFGSRIAKLEGKEKGADTCSRLK